LDSGFAFSWFSSPLSMDGKVLIRRADEAEYSRYSDFQQEIAIDRSCYNALAISLPIDREFRNQAYAVQPDQQTETILSRGYASA
jgi:hypothetical protein